MYHKFDVTKNLLFIECIFQANTAFCSGETDRPAAGAKAAALSPVLGVAPRRCCRWWPPHHCHCASWQWISSSVQWRAERSGAVFRISAGRCGLRCAGLVVLWLENTPTLLRSKRERSSAVASALVQKRFGCCGWGAPACCSLQEQDGDARPGR
jgi:hypothetical protein